MTLLESSYWPAPAPARIANAILFNISWFAIVMTQSGPIALAILALHLVVHFCFIGKGRSELHLIIGVMIFGAAVDQLLFLFGVFNLAGQSALAPLWLACLWPVFATTLMHAFDGFQHRLFQAAVLGAAGGALSYTAGVRLTAVEFGSSLWGPIIIAVLWAFFLPLLLQVAARLSRNSDPIQSWHPGERRAFD